MYVYDKKPTLNDDGSLTEGEIIFPFDVRNLKSEMAALGTPLSGNITERELNSRGVYTVVYDDEPEYDKIAQRLVPSTTPVKVDGKWKITYTVENKSQEEAEDSVRAHRNFLISETDWWAGSDHTMTQLQSDYRTALRNVPQQSGFPYSVTWPTKP